MSNFINYLGAVLSHWFALLSGSAILVIIGIVERKKKNNISWKWYCVAIGFLLFYGTYLAWNDEHTQIATKTRELGVTANEIATKQDEIKQLQQDISVEKNKITPNLKGNIDRVIWAYSPDVEGVVILTQVTIENLGATMSVKEPWLLTIEGENINVQLPPTHNLRRSENIRDKRGKIIGKIDNTEYLYEKTTKPIEPRSRVRGWLKFIARGIKDEDLPIGTKLTVQFSDLADATYSATHTITKQKVEVGYSPGTKNPLLLPRSRRK